MRIVGSFNTENYDPIRVTYFPDAELNEIHIVLTGSYFPFFSASIEGIDYQSAVDYINEEMNALLTTSYFQMGYDFSQNYFWIECDAGQISLSANGKKFFGIDNRSSAAGMFLTGSRVPYFVYDSNELCFSKYSDEFEDYNPQKQSVADDGSVFAISSFDNANYDYIKFTLVNEPRWKVFSYQSSSLVPYTWQEHVQELRSFRPYVLFPKLTSVNVGYEQRHSTLRTKGIESNFRPRKMFNDMYDYWEVDSFCKVISTGSNFTTSIVDPSNPVIEPSGALPPNAWAMFLPSDLGASGSTVSTWNNRGSGFTELSTSSGTPKVGVDGTYGKYLEVTDTCNIVPASSVVSSPSSDWTLVFVGRITSQFTTHVFNIEQNSDGTKGIDFGKSGTSSDLLCWRINNRASPLFITVADSIGLQCDITKSFAFVSDQRWTGTATAGNTYVNGELVSYRSTSEKINLSNITAMKVGGKIGTTDNSFRGRIYMMILYDRVLNSSELSVLHAYLQDNYPEFYNEDAYASVG